MVLREDIGRRPAVIDLEALDAEHHVFLDDGSDTLPLDCRPDAREQRGELRFEKARELGCLVQGGSECREIRPRAARGAWNGQPQRAYAEVEDVGRQPAGLRLAVA